MSVLVMKIKTVFDWQLYNTTDFGQITGRMKQVTDNIEICQIKLNRGVGRLPFRNVYNIQVI